jgi:hypothetical protein
MESGFDEGWYRWVLVFELALLSALVAFGWTQI